MKKLLKYPPIVFIAFILVNFILNYSIDYLIEFINPPSISTMSSGVAKDNTQWYAFFACAFVEELIFRVFPLMLLIMIDKYKNKYWLCSFIMISSIIFGYVHGNYLNIFLQGISGVLFWLALIYMLQWLDKRFPSFSFESDRIEHMLIISFIFVSLLHFFYNMFLEHIAPYIIYYLFY